MKIIVGRTVKIVCSRSESRVGSSDLDCTRARRVCSESTGAPQFEQNRTLGVTYAPQTEQVIGFSSFAHVSYKTRRPPSKVPPRCCFLSGLLSHQRSWWLLWTRAKYLLSRKAGATNCVGGLGDTLRDYWLTSCRRPSG